MSGIMVASESVIAQTIQTTKTSTNPKDQITIGGLPQGIAINTKTNKIYVLNQLNGSVSVINSNSGDEVKNIRIGNAYNNTFSRDCLGQDCIKVDDRYNMIYVINPLDNRVFVIDGTNDTVRSVSVGVHPDFILVSPSNKIYVVNAYDPTISVINGTNDTARSVPVGFSKLSAVFINNKIYVLNGNDTVSVIDGTKDNVTKLIPLTNCQTIATISRYYSIARLPPLLYPTFSCHFVPYSSMAARFVGGIPRIYVVGNDTVSVIDGNMDNVTRNIRVPSMLPPSFILLSYFLPIHGYLTKHYAYAYHYRNHTVFKKGQYLYRPLIEKAYVGNRSGTISVINPFNNINEPNIKVGKGNVIGGIVSDPQGSKIYVSNSNSTDDIVSIFDVSNQSKPDKWEKDIKIGQGPGRGAPPPPGPIAFSGPKFRMIYVGNTGNGTISVINGWTGIVAVGVKFKVNPVGSGTITCGSQEYPTNKYIYIDEGTTCKAQGNNFFTFDRWLQDLGHNSSIPISDTSGNIIVNRYANFTANFIPPHQITAEELAAQASIISSQYSIIAAVISAAVAVNGALLVVPGWRRARNQRTHLRECIQMIDNDADKSHKDAIEDKILGYYVDGKISEDHRQMLKDKI